jgi:hypothetical protein
MFVAVDHYLCSRSDVQKQASIMYQQIIITATVPIHSGPELHIQYKSYAHTATIAIVTSTLYERAKGYKLLLITFAVVSALPVAK